MPLTLTPRQARQLLARGDSLPMPTKYGNRRTSVDGLVFDSKAEAAHYQALKLRELAGEITDLRVHPRYRLMDGSRDGQGKAIRPIDYIADFEYREAGALVTVDVKGVETEAFRIKAKLFRQRYPTHRLELVKGKPR